MTPESVPSAPPTFRGATRSDLEDLVELERAASTAALGHVFPPAQYPYPVDEVRDRWRRVLADDRTRVLMADDALGPVCLIAFDDDLIHHLAVRPDRWRSGWGRAAVTEVVGRAGCGRLWCLQDNHRALAAYDRMGWRPSGREQRAEFAPYPVEVELIRVVAGSS